VPQKFFHIIRCGKGGCVNEFAWTDDKADDDHYTLEYARWHFDHGVWICWNHPLTEMEKKVPVVIRQLSNLPVGVAAISKDGHFVTLQIDNERARQELLSPEAKILGINYGIRQKVYRTTAEEKNQARMNDPEALLQ
jgi:hypothetical protein